MSVAPDPYWLLVIAAAALTGWWLALRPQASYRNVSATMSMLIVLMGVLLCVLAFSGQHGVRRPASPPQAASSP